MKYVYKIHSNYDGFTPARLPDRMVGNVLRLGWKKYIDTVEPGDEIWVYFHGRHQFRNGVYAKGIAKEVDYSGRTVLLAVTQHVTDKPLTEPNLSVRIAAVVATRYQQVFVLPEELDTAPVCTIFTTADSCASRLCNSCRVWMNLPKVKPGLLAIPHRLDGHVDVYVPAYWVIPNRSFLYKKGRRIRRGVRRSSEVFMRFKTGEENLAYPLAVGMHQALARARSLDADIIVPVPLSPDKAKRGELHRTLRLARELSRLTGVPVREPLSLSKPVSKRRLRTQLGYSAASFESAYAATLATDTALLTGVKRVLLVDDVCTEGSTLRECGDALHHAAADVHITAVTAGQMTVTQVVKDPSPLWDPLST